MTNYPHLLLFLIVPFLTLTITAEENPWVERMLQRDANGNGSLEGAEINASLRRMLPQIDTDKDRALSKAELLAVAKRFQNRQGAKASAAVPDGVTIRRDVAYREGHAKWKLDLYLPKGEAPKGGRPGLVVVHGGGWKGGDKQGGLWSSLPAEYAGKGYVAISVNYRLHPEVGMLDCIADVKCAVRWLRANAEEFGLDPERLGAYGNSAGAHLVCMLGLTDKEDDLEGDGPHKEHSSQVQAVCAAATPTDFMNWNGRELISFAPIAKGGGDTKARALKVAPVTYVSADAPPIMLVHAENDRVVPYGQGKRMTEKLKAAGAKVEWLSFKDGGHGVFGAKKAETGPAMSAFFEKALKPPDR